MLRWQRFQASQSQRNQRQGALNAGGDATVRSPRSRRPQFQYEPLPLLLERFHVVFAENALQRIVSGRIAFHVGGKLVVKLHEQSSFLEIVAEIAGLAVIL